MTGVRTSLGLGFATALLVAAVTLRRFSSWTVSTKGESLHLSYHRQLHDAPNFIPPHRHLEQRYEHADAISCVTHQVSEEDQLASQRAVEWARFRQQQNEQNIVETGFNADSTAQLEGPRLIPICFHNPQPYHGFRGWIANYLFRNNHISTQTMQLQLDQLNKAYSAESCCNPARHSWCNASNPCSPAGNTGFEFVMATVDQDGVLDGGITTSALDPNACVMRPVGDEYMQLTYRTTSEKFVKATLRKGDASILNVYFMTAYLEGDSVLGFATFPWDYADEPILDGVVIAPRTVIGSAPFQPRFSEGDTLVHEVGHWLGLFHTFEKGCHDVNDGVADTPQQAFPSFGCSPSDEAWDSCPNDPGADPIHNYMGYNDDVCLYQWTPGQAAAMQANYDLYRKQSADGKSRVVSSQPTVLQDGVATEPQTMFAEELRLLALFVDIPEELVESNKKNIFSTESAGYDAATTVVCTKTASAGDVVLLMNWNGSLENFECTNGSDDGACSISLTSDQHQAAYVVLYASSDASDVSVTCTTIWRV